MQLKILTYLATTVFVLTILCGDLSSGDDKSNEAIRINQLNADEETRQDQEFALYSTFVQSSSILTKALFDKKINDSVFQENEYQLNQLIKLFLILVEIKEQ